jgi:exonuclease VII large subunit
VSDKKKHETDKTPAEVLSDLMNVPFPNAAYLESMKRVFALQKQMLDGFQTNLDQWFERRRKAAEATLTMLNAMNGENDHQKRAEAWQRWVSGTMARIMDDVQTQFDTMAKITGQLAENGEIVMPEELKAPKKRPLNGKGEHIVVKKGATRPKAETHPRTTN